MALAGAANSIPKVGWLVDGIISGGYAAYTSYKNGASTEGVVATGVINGVCSMISIGNIAKYLGNALDKAVEIAVDVVFGSGNSLISAGISRGITEKTVLLARTYRYQMDGDMQAGLHITHNLQINNL